MAKWNKGQPAHNRNTEMIGKRFGKLVVLAEYQEKDKDKRIAKGLQRRTIGMVVHIEAAGSAYMVSIVI